MLTLHSGSLSCNQGPPLQKSCPARTHLLERTLSAEPSAPWLAARSQAFNLQVLVIVAASHLDAVTFQICSQSFKIMPTAVFAVWLLGQYLTPMQWSSLPVLAFGVVFVTMNGSSASAAGQSSNDQILLGLGASALSGLSSAYAGQPTLEVQSCPEILPSACFRVPWTSYSARLHQQLVRHTILST